MKDLIAKWIGEARFSKVFTDLIPGIILVLAILLIINFNNNIDQNFQKDTSVGKLKVEIETQQDIINFYKEKIKLDKEKISSADIEKIEKLASDLEKKKKKLIDDEKLIDDQIFQKQQLNKLGHISRMKDYFISVEHNLYPILFFGLISGILISQIARGLFIELIFSCFFVKDKSPYYYIGQGKLDENKYNNLISIYYTYTEICINNVIPLFLLSSVLVYYFSSTRFITCLITMGILSTLIYTGFESYKSFKLKTEELIRGSIGDVSAMNSKKITIDIEVSLDALKGLREKISEVWLLRDKQEHDGPPSEESDNGGYMLEILENKKFAIRKELSVQSGLKWLIGVIDDRNNIIAKTTKQTLNEEGKPQFNDWIAIRKNGVVT